MSDTPLEEVSFNIILSSTWWNNPPSVKIWVNDELVENTKITELQEKKERRTISFKKNLKEGDNTVAVELYNKTWDETEVDSAEAKFIYRDQLLYIEDIEIDEISLGHIVYRESNFYPNKKWHPDLPDVMKDLNTLGYNGKLELKFQVPTYIWFLENL